MIISESEKEVRAKYWHPQVGQVVVDIGCQNGLYSLPALQAGATVYAIDPDKCSLYDLVTNAEGQTSGLTTIACALGEESGYPEDTWEEMETTKNNDGGTGVFYLFPRSTPFTTLDKLVQKCNITRLDWIKIDVEGGELSVLKGAVNSLTKFHPALLIEDHSLVYAFCRDNNFTGQIKQLLTSLNYQIEDYYYDKEHPPRGYIIAK